MCPIINPRPMNTVQFVSQVLAIMYLSIGIGFFINPRFYRKKLKEMVTDSRMTLSFGLMALLAGFAIIKLHGEWTADWEVLITIIGWGALIKGIMYLMVPNLMLNLTEKLFSKRSYMRFWTVIIIALGLVFGYMGFFLFA